MVLKRGTCRVNSIDSEILQIVLNFFPGDHFTAEKYKAFVVQITKQHQAKDSKINIDDYFHIEDQREWTFFIGNPEYIAPWWSKGLARFLLSCVLLWGWPLRMGYSGQVSEAIDSVSAGFSIALVVVLCRLPSTR